MTALNRHHNWPITNRRPDRAKQISCAQFVVYLTASSDTLSSPAGFLCALIWSSHLEQSKDLSNGLLCLSWAPDAVRPDPTNPDLTQVLLAAAKPCVCPASRKLSCSPVSELACQQATGSGGGRPASQPSSKLAKQCQLASLTNGRHESLPAPNLEPALTL